jgi:CDP-glucose 4,6-dehydratase
LESLAIDPAFWSQQRILLTGHTGFKGAWLALWLELLGAKTVGLALAPDSDPNLFSLLQPFSMLDSRLGDIRDPSIVTDVMAAADPTMIIHMAAQSLVRRSYRDPVATFMTNVMGTAHVLEASRAIKSVRSLLVITSDKVYRNLDKGRPFVETDCLGGDDPYSASKAATELAVSSWAHSFVSSGRPSIATARAGNVVGGGDWSEDRIVPDLWRAAQSDKPAVLRYPKATRPWQHVLDPLFGYLALAQHLARNEPNAPLAINFGPSPAAALTVAEVADIVLDGLGAHAGWICTPELQPPEKGSLALDSSFAARMLGWRPKLDARDALQWTVDWHRRVAAGANPRAVTIEQIQRYQALA